MKRQFVVLTITLIVVLWVASPSPAFVFEEAVAPGRVVQSAPESPSARPDVPVATRSQIEPPVVRPISLTNSQGLLLSELAPEHSEVLEGVGSLTAAYRTARVTATAIQVQPPVPAPPRFDVASVKVNRSGFFESEVRPIAGRFVATNVSLKSLIAEAYQVQEFQILGAPDWFESEKYDIDANVERVATNAETWLMLQSLLANRFQLKLQREVTNLPVYELIVANGTPRLSEPIADRSPGGGLSAGRGRIAFNKLGMEFFAHFLSIYMGRPVSDKTSLPGEFSLNLKWSPEGGGIGIEGSAAPGPVPLDGLTIFTALEDQLGLRLQLVNASYEALIIEQAEKPIPN